MENTINANLIEAIIKKIEKDTFFVSPDDEYGKDNILVDLKRILNTQRERQYSQAEIDSWNGMGK